MMYPASTSLPYLCTGYHCVHLTDRFFGVCPAWVVLAGSSAVAPGATAGMELAAILQQPASHPQWGSAAALAHLQSPGATSSSTTPPNASTTAFGGSSGARHTAAFATPHRQQPASVGYLSAGPVKSSYERTPVGPIATLLPHSSPTHRSVYEAVARSRSRALLHHGPAGDMEVSARASSERVLVGGPTASPRWSV